MRRNSFLLRDFEKSSKQNRLSLAKRPDLMRRFLVRERRTPPLYNPMTRVAISALTPRDRLEKTERHGRLSSRHSAARLRNSSRRNR
jgi:hypothetical protein